MGSAAGIKVRAITGLLFATATIVFAAIPVDNLTAEVLGIPPEDFISPEEAKKIATTAHDPWSRDYPVDNAIIFPWLIESRDNYEPEISMGFYEVTVYTGEKRYSTFDALDAKVQKYLNVLDPLIYFRDGEWDVEPRDLLSREDLTRELFGNSYVFTFWVPINRQFGQKKMPWGDAEVGWNTLMLHICSTVASQVVPGSNPIYETNICFSGAVQFMVFKTNNGRIFVQTSDIHNRFRVFTNEADFDEYFQEHVGTLNLETFRY